MNKKFSIPYLISILTLFGFCLLFILPINAQEDSGEESPNLYVKYRNAKKLPCGQRDEAIKVGKYIIEKYKDETENKKIVDFIKQDVPKIEAEEKRCNPPDSLENLYNAYREAKKLPCGQRDEAVKLGKEMIERFKADAGEDGVINFLKNDVPKIEEQENLCKNADSFENLYKKYQSAKKAPCGERDEAIRVGKKILELYGDDKDNQAIIVFLKNDIPKIESADLRCRREKLYNESYKAQNWSAFLKISKELIAEERNTPLALDLMLTHVSFSFDQAAYAKNDSYNSEIIFYAKKAIALIESGVMTKMRWGVFKPYDDRENALGWLNYIIGYISYFREKEGKKAIAYFYKATQYQAEFKYDAFVYHAVAVYYFDKDASSASVLTIREFIAKATEGGNDPNIEGANNLTKKSAKKDELAELYKQLVKLYNLRYALEKDEQVSSLEDYIQKLIERPLIDTANDNKKKQ